MRICWIEDEQHNVDTFKVTLSGSDVADVFTLDHYLDFDKAEKVLECTEFSILIIDLKNNATDNLDGAEILARVFADSFCPVVVYSALAATSVPAEISAHPLIKCVQKGAGADILLLDALKEISGKVSFLKEARKTIKSINLRLMKDWYPATAGVVGLSDEDRARLFMRRFAASLDFAFHLNEDRLNPWELYLYPPLPDTDLLTGDILRKRDGSYLFVLTPSCDMVRSGGRTAKVTNVLTARMDKIDVVLREASDFKDKTQATKLRDAIESRRKKEPEGSTFILPRLNDVDLPGFVVALKDLSLIPINEISLTQNETSQFLRIASIDSPFRENISGLIAKDFGRLGLPDLDLDKWANAYWEIHPKRTL